MNLASCVGMKICILLLFAYICCQKVYSTMNSNGSFEEIYPTIYEGIDTVPLYFGLMLSLSGDHQSSGALAGVRAALDEINDRDDLLPGHSLHYTLTDSKVS